MRTVRSNAQVAIQRICVKAKPMPANPDYYEWQTAVICMFVPDNDKQIAVERAQNELVKRRWEFISYVNKSTLIEDRVREAGGEILEAFEAARKGNLIFKVFPEHFGSGNKERVTMLPARITEDFIDKVVADAGGRRLSEKEKETGVKNADYLIGQFVFELKDVQEEGLDKPEHQAKLARLFQNYFSESSEIAIDPSILSKPDYLKYLDIIGVPIKTHIRKASKQTKETKELLERQDLVGGIILLNTGFGTFPHDAFAEQVERYAKKDSSQFTVAISISVWSSTNGFDTYVFYKFSPTYPAHEEVHLLKKAFGNRFEQMMTDMVRGNIPSATERATPSRPIAFEHSGINFAWEPPRIPLPWEEN